jgi:hypothetical protein
MPTEDDRPKWLLTYFSGMYERRYYSVVIEGETHAIVKCAGHMAWTNNIDPWHWERTKYDLVTKLADRGWSRDQDRKELGTGRLTKAKLSEYTKILKQADLKGKK